MLSTFGPGEPDMTVGRTIGGPGSTQIEVAIGFMAGFDGEVDWIKLAAFHTAGPNNYIVSLAADSTGAPGAALETFSNLTFPDTGAILTLNSSLRPLLFLGSSYWVVMSAANLEASWGAWSLNDQGALGLSTRSSMTGFLWSAEPSFTSPAVEVNATSQAGAEADAPEPATFGLMFAGLTVLLISIAARRNRAWPRPCAAFRDR
jgi:hypothetical protein